MMTISQVDMALTFLDLTHEKLRKLGSDDEATSEYVALLIQDEDMEKDEKIETIMDVLTDLEPTSVLNLVNELLNDHERRKLEQAKAGEIAEFKALEEARAREKEILATEKDQPTEIARELTKQEKLVRQKIIRAYANEETQIVENERGEAEIVYKDCSGRIENTPSFEANTNAERVRREETARRETSRAAHQQQVERNKMLLEKQRLEKEKEKRRTQKKEKRRI